MTRSAQCCMRSTLRVFKGVGTGYFSIDINLKDSDIQSAILETRDRITNIFTAEK